MWMSVTGTSLYKYPYAQESHQIVIPIKVPGTLVDFPARYRTRNLQQTQLGPRLLVCLSTVSVLTH